MITYNQWTLSPYASLSTADRAFSVYSTSRVDTYRTFYGNGVRPAVYLASNVKILAGDGTANNPITLG